MDRSEVYPLILISLFLVFYATLASSALAIVSDTSDIEQPYLANFTPISDNVAYEVINSPLDISQEGQTYYNYSDSQGDLVPWTYEVSGYNDVRCSINDYGTGYTFTLIKQDEGAWFPWDDSEVSYSDDELLDEVVLPSDTQMTLKVNLQKTFDVTIVSYEGETLEQSLINKHFSVILGENKKNVSVNEAGAFDSFISLVSFNIPDLDPTISFLIASPIYILGTYLLVRVVIMFLPFVSGGA
jgi:hypothetical protein